jgi:hypothetical protein
MVAGTAQFLGKISYVDYKEFDNGNCLLKFNLAMAIEGYNDQPATVEIIQLTAFGKMAKSLRLRLENDGHNFAIVLTDVRCKPFKNREGNTSAFPSFSIRSICTEKRGDEKNTNVDLSEDEMPF